jgi:putative tricarboxylic transport membrane protein
MIKTPRIHPALLALALALAPAIAMAQAFERIHFLIPAGPGGGWDGTARGIGEALIKGGLVSNISYENLSGGGGGRAIAKLIETAERQQDTLMVNSTPIIVRSLQRIFPQSFRDLTPIASVIADYSCFVVAKNSPYTSWPQVVQAMLGSARAVKVAGGSVRGSTDHLVVAEAFKKAGGNPRAVVYIAYDGGGKAMTGLLSGETQLLSTGLSETVDLARAGEVRILAITAEQRLPELPDVPTVREHGQDVVFANWRGFFGPPAMAPGQREQLIDLMRRLVSSDAFEVVRARNGWVTLLQTGPDFYRFLEHQELEIGRMMREMGFLDH